MNMSIIVIEYCRSTAHGGRITEDLTVTVLFLALSVAHPYLISPQSNLNLPPFLVILVVASLSACMLWFCSTPSPPFTAVVPCAMPFKLSSGRGFYPEVGIDPVTYYISFARLAPVQVLISRIMTMILVYPEVGIDPVTY